MAGPEPGWYDDPDDSTRERWWDGDGWGDQRRVRAAEPPQASEPPAPSGHSGKSGGPPDWVERTLTPARANWLLGALVVATGILLLAAVGVAVAAATSTDQRVQVAITGTPEAATLMCVGNEFDAVYGMHWEVEGSADVSVLETAAQADAACADAFASWRSGRYVLAAILAVIALAFLAVRRWFKGWLTRELGAIWE